MVSEQKVQTTVSIITAAFSSLATQKEVIVTLPETARQTDDICVDAFCE